jgi:hypothetical protein
MSTSDEYVSTVDYGRTTPPTQPALDVLRTTWSADGESSVNIDELADPKICKRAEGLDFGGFGEPSEVGAEGDLRTSWRAKLAREGKLASGSAAISMRDLVLGPDADEALPDIASQGFSR